MSMNIDNLLQLGFAGSIAVYLVIFLVNDVKRSQAKILDVLDKVVEILRAKS